MSFFDTLNRLVQSIGDKAGDAVENSRLASGIAAEHAAAAEALKKVGEHYYAVFVCGGEVAAEAEAFCRNAQAHYEAAAGMQVELDRLRAAAEARQAVASVASGPICPSCGTPCSPGMKFCRECGTGLPPPAKPEKRNCPDCGAATDIAAKFCSGCGRELDQPAQSVAE